MDLDHRAQDSLLRLVDIHGLDHVSDPDWLQEQLETTCSDCPLETFLLVEGARLELPRQIRLLEIPNVPREELIRTSIILPLHTRLALDEVAARWLAECWAEALGVDLSLLPTLQFPLFAQSLERWLGEELAKLLVEHGYNVCTEPSRLAQLLGGTSRRYPREFYLLRVMLEEGLVAALLPASVRTEELVTQLTRTRGVSAASAQWAVEVWQNALTALRDHLLSALYQGTASADDSLLSSLFQRNCGFLSAWAFQDAEAAVIARAAARLADRALRALHRTVEAVDNPSLVQQAAEAEALLGKHFWHLPPELEERIALARAGGERLTTLRELLRTGRAADAARYYEDNEAWLVGRRDLTMQERRAILAARRQRALAALDSVRAGGSDEMLIAVGTRALELGCDLADAARRAIREARARRSAYAVSLPESGDEWQVILAYARAGAFSEDSTLQEWRSFAEARERLARWYPLQAALGQRNEREIIQYYDPGLFEGSQLLTDAERQQCELALARWDAHQQLAPNIQPTDEAALAHIVGNPSLMDSTLLTSSQKEQARRACEWQELVGALMDSLESGEWERAVQLWKDLTVRGYPIAQLAEQNTQFLDKLRVGELLARRAALTPGDVAVRAELYRLGRLLAILGYKRSGTPGTDRGEAIGVDEQAGTDRNEVGMASMESTHKLVEVEDRGRG